MPRPAAKRAIKQDRAVKTRQDILTSAITLFARRGILATTMAELARAINMTPGALYWHFPTKEDLLLAAIEELNERYLASFAPTMTEMLTWPAAKQLEGFMARTAEFLHEHREHGIFYGLVGAEAAENNADVASALRAAMSIYVGAIESILRYGQHKTKEFRLDVDAHAVANTIIFSNLGVLLQQNLFRDTVSYPPLVQTLTRVVIDGLVVSQPEGLSTSSESPRQARQ
jgi:AcrR family transcriptional regulator